ncbi:hypothetical protein FPZ43_07450 [Mucilaginibacter pallidiroseus]|uniref:Uncharacterized protein n=1 Tax=Mucilaginibacter pallidiroseus TaxID=2599295 RepID=A0A563UEB0_9SPHI|nr:hypothetical protein [Mucilaginibacter pallidiroseus]TWR29688.1 hypothetical protein FPZ43_07450 [Mucilaginibacter pallidiroseus]
MKLIGPKLHGIIDYIMIVFLFAAPTLYTMPTHSMPLVYSIATAFLLLTVLTNYSFGVFKSIPLRVHGIIELVLSIVLIILAFTFFKYDDRARPFYLSFGVFLFIIAIFSDYSRKRDVLKAPIL